MTGWGTNPPPATNAMIKLRGIWIFVILEVTANVKTCKAEVDPKQLLKCSSPIRVVSRLKKRLQLVVELLEVVSRKRDQGCRH